MTNLVNSKVATIILFALVILVLFSFVLVFMATTGRFEIVDASTLRYCVSSGSVCTGV